MAASCTEDNAEMPDVTAVPLKITLSMPDVPQPADAVTRVAFEKDDTTPLSLTAKWKTDDEMVLILFQGDNVNWKDNCKIHKFTIPAEADGQTTANLTAAAGTVDLEGFDSSKPLKYVVATGYSWHDTDKNCKFGNGRTSYKYYETLETQLQDMVFATPVQEIHFPSGALEIGGKLEWLTAVLALKFNISPEAQTVKVKDGSMLFFILTGNSSNYVNFYDPVLRKKIFSTTSFSAGISWYDESDTPLSDALDAGGFRYFTIPADNMSEGIQITGSKVKVQEYVNSAWGDKKDVGVMNPDIPIQCGKCYGFEIDVTDADGDGTLEFTKAAP